MGQYDRGSKWLVQHHGDSILRLAGVQDITSWRPLQAEVIQPAQLPDGLLEVQIANAGSFDLYILEFATYPEYRVYEQLVRDTALVLLDRRVLPEVLVVVLRPKGQFGVSDSHELTSPRGWTKAQFGWRVVKLWELDAQEILALQDPGLVPWIPLMQFDGTPESILQRCRDEIDRAADPHERNTLLAVTQVFAKLKFNDPQLLTILGGMQAMIESPLIQELLADRRQKDLLRFLESRFGTVPHELAETLRSVTDDARLDELMTFAARCDDLEAFRRRVQSS